MEPFTPGARERCAICGLPCVGHTRAENKACFDEAVRRRIITRSGENQ